LKNNLVGRTQPSLLSQYKSKILIAEFCINEMKEETSSTEINICQELLAIIMD
jgi:hypothetical protein